MAKVINVGDKWPIFQKEQVGKTVEGFPIFVIKETRFRNAIYNFESADTGKCLAVTSLQLDSDETDDQHTAHIRYEIPEAMSQEEFTEVLRLELIAFLLNHRRTLLKDKT